MKEYPFEKWLNVNNTVYLSGKYVIKHMKSKNEIEYYNQNNNLDYVHKIQDDFLIMYYKGISLFEKIPSINLNIFAINLLNEIHNIHKNNYLYLNLKPSNILINENNEITIVDFKMCKHKQDKTKTLFIIDDNFTPIKKKINILSDYESLGYILIYYFNNGNIYWSNVKKKILNIKNILILNYLDYVKTITEKNFVFDVVLNIFSIDNDIKDDKLENDNIINNINNIINNKANIINNKVEDYIKELSDLESISAKEEYLNNIPINFLYYIAFFYKINYLDIYDKSKIINLIIKHNNQIERNENFLMQLVIDCIYKKYNNET